MNGQQEDRPMLDGKRYYAEFPDEDPAGRKPVLVYSRSLMVALRALEKELRPFIPSTRADG